MTKENDPHYSPPTNDWKKPEQQYPHYMRHYFKVQIPEDISVVKPIADEKNAWMDVLISNKGKTVDILDYGVIIDKYDCRRPEWMNTELLEIEKRTIRKEQKGEN